MSAPSFRLGTFSRLFAACLGIMASAATLTAQSPEAQSLQAANRTALEHLDQAEQALLAKDGERAVFHYLWAAHKYRGAGFAFTSKSLRPEDQARAALVDKLYELTEQQRRRAHQAYEQSLQHEANGHYALAAHFAREHLAKRILDGPCGTGWEMPELRLIRLQYRCGQEQQAAVAAEALIFQEYGGCPYDIAQAYVDDRLRYGSAEGLSAQLQLFKAATVVAHQALGSEPRILDLALEHLGTRQVEQYLAFRQAVQAKDVQRLWNMVARCRCGPLGVDDPNAYDLALERMASSALVRLSGPEFFLDQFGRSRAGDRWAVVLLARVSPEQGVAKAAEILGRAATPDEMATECVYALKLVGGDAAEKALAAYGAKRSFNLEHIERELNWRKFR